MTSQKSGKIGYVVEEVLREYFLELGYFVVRGIKVRLGSQDATDIDLFLYQRSGPFFRSRVNVDIKYKGSPKAFERIAWAKGLQTVLRLDNCVVATTDSRPELKAYSISNNVTLLDGKALIRLKNRYNNSSARLSDEEFYKLIAPLRKDPIANEQIQTVELAKERLISHLDFDGVNSWLGKAAELATSYLDSPQRSNGSLRILYLLLSFVMVGLDFIMKDMMFEEQKSQVRILTEGLRYGNGGKASVTKIVTAAKNLADAAGVSVVPVVNNLDRQFNAIPVEIVAEFITKPLIAQNLFRYAKELESLAYARELNEPDNLPTAIKAVFGMLLDFSGLQRRDYFTVSSTETKASQQEFISKIP